MHTYAHFWVTMKRRPEVAKCLKKQCFFSPPLKINKVKQNFLPSLRSQNFQPSRVKSWWFCCRHQCLLSAHVSTPNNPGNPNMTRKGFTPSTLRVVWSPGIFISVLLANGFWTWPTGGANLKQLKHCGFFFAELFWSCLKKIYVKIQVSFLDSSIEFLISWIELPRERCRWVWFQECHRHDVSRHACIQTDRHTYIPTYRYIYLYTLGTSKKKNSGKIF